MDDGDVLPPAHLWSGALTRLESELTQLVSFVLRSDEEFESPRIESPHITTAYYRLVPGTYWLHGGR